MKKNSSLWDLPRPTLDPIVWTEDDKLLPQHRAFILDELYKGFKSLGYTAYDGWVVGVYLTGSLASYQYNEGSDADVDVVVNAGRIADREYKRGIEPEQAKTVLEDLKDRMKSNIVNLPGTNHPIEFYFVYEDIKSKTVLPTNVGLYDVYKDDWATPPKKTDLTSVVEKVYPEMMKFVQEMAEKYQLQVTEIKKDIIDVEYLKSAIGQFPPKYLPIIQEQVAAKIDEINEEIEGYLDRTKELIDDRFSGPYPQMPAELQVGYLRRYGYMTLNKMLKKITDNRKVEEGDLPELNELVKDVPKAAKRYS